MMTFHHMMGLHHMMEFHHMVDIHHFIEFVKSLAVLTTYDRGYGCSGGR